MKEIKVTYSAGGKILAVDDNSAYFEQENEALQIGAKIETAKNVRAYIKAPNGNSHMTETIKPSEGVYSVVINKDFMAKGTLYVGFEVFDESGYIERFEPLKVYIDSFVNLGTGNTDNVYVVTVDVAETVTLPADEGAKAEVVNIGTQKDMRLKFYIPKGDTGEKGDKGDTGAIEVGTVTTLEPGEAAYVKKTGNEDAVLDFGIPKGEKGDAFVYEDFTSEQLAGLKGEKGDVPEFIIEKVNTLGPGALAYVENVGTSPEEIALEFGIPRGRTGEAFKYEDFTPEQLEGLRGPQGEKGDKGDKGDRGEAFLYENFTEEQLKGLTGPKGDKGDTGEKGEQGEKGDKGDAFVYEDFTPEQLAGLKGEKGDTGAKGDKGDKGKTGNDGYTPQKGTDYYTPEEAEVFALEVEQKYVESMNKKVDKVEGKGLSEADFTEEEKQFLHNINDKFANSLKGYGKGNVMAFDDVSPNKHNLNVKVSSKNLFNNDTSLMKELTYYNSEGTETVRYGYEIILPVGTYTIKPYAKSTYNNAGYIYVAIVDSNYNQKTGMRMVTEGTLSTVTITVEEGDKLLIYNGIDAIKTSLSLTKTLFLNFNFQLELGTEASDYVPYDVSAVSLSVYGKNLFNNDTSLMKELTFYNSEGKENVRYGYEILLPVGTYTIRAYSKENSFSLQYVYGGVVDETNTQKREVKTVVNDSCKTVVFEIGDGEKLLVYNGSNSSNLSASRKLFTQFDFQLELGEYATELEAYIEPVIYTPNAERTVEEVKSIYPNMTLLTTAEGVTIDCKYNRDINKVVENIINAIISLGGNV